MDKPKVSILIPCYNSETYLQETLQSCITQQYPNIEIIIVDDGSTDKSVEIAKDWVHKFDNIQLYSQPNSGVCCARNLAFERSTGDYIVYLDSDDLISSDLISSQMELLEGANDNVIATCSWGRFYTSIDDFNIEKKSVYKDYESSIGLIEDLLNDGMFGLTCYLTPRSIIDKAGTWNETLTINTDGEFFIRVIANADKIKFSKHGCLFYRSNNPNSISRRKPIEAKGASLLFSYELILEYLKSRNLLTPMAKVGLKKLFQAVAYQYVIYNHIVDRARKQVKALGNIKDKPNIGGSIFRILCYLIGFWNVLFIKHLLSCKK
ncbi:glycosyltransferase family 2 protein [Dysgonomonas termitidis]|uniref:Glycosyltransferase family 2 protein n=2 Tax=Dysgonomonas termitidis TaxID=1516126 RepID=A0ABV9KXM5_9BACT